MNGILILSGPMPLTMLVIIYEFWRVVNAPFYMFSDFLDVSYAYSWIAPPSGVYSLAFDTFDGVGAIYTSSIGDIDTTVYLTYGSNNSEIEVSGEDVKPSFDDFFGGSFTLTRNWLTLRTGYFQTQMNIDVQASKPLAQGGKLLDCQMLALILKCPKIQDHLLS